MSGKLDQSLDQIMKDSGATRPRRGKGGRLPNRKAAQKSKAATTAVIAPSGGVQKKTKTAKPLRTPAVPIVPVSGESKINVSNLPDDVTEALIKDYFSATAGPVKRVMVNYGPNGRSRGSAIVIFSKPDAAAKAAKADGTKIDQRPMRVEILLGAKQVVQAPPPKALADRVSGPKNAAKENQKKNQKKEGPKAAVNGEKKAGGAKKSGRAGRPKKKTADELDAEMQDYFGGGEASAATNGTAQPIVTTNGGDAMDEVL